MRNNIKGELIALSDVFKPIQVVLMEERLSESAEPRIFYIKINGVRYGFLGVIIKICCD